MRVSSTVLIAGLIAGLVVCACVPSVPAASATTYEEKVLYSFCSQSNCTDGQRPSSNLMVMNGKLYGTTLDGGAENSLCGSPTCGTVFSFDYNTGAEQVLYAFCTQSVCSDGANPRAGLIAAGDTLYGTTLYGGAGCNGLNGNNCGTVFSLDPGTGAEAVLYDFAEHRENGAAPSAGLNAVTANGWLYGTTEESGYNRGTVFSFEPGAGRMRVLYTFCQQDNCTDGAYPGGSVIAANGKLYGMTNSGGTGCGCGTVFSVDQRTGAETVIHSFAGYPTDGASPGAGLNLVKGILYGVTSEGGTNCAQYGCGTVFSLDPASGVEHVMYSFCVQQGCADGAFPAGGLIAVNGAFYGVTQSGGNPGCSNNLGCGTVFSIDPGTGAETVLYSFCNEQRACADGAAPVAGLVAVDGNFYGTTAGGGAKRAGAVFELWSQHQTPMHVNDSEHYGQDRK